MKTRSEREKIVVRTSVISIITNLVLVIFKATVGLISNSIAIISDAVNNLSDAMSSIITIIGTKLANKAPDKEHPYGHGRIEYVTEMIVSAIVLYAGMAAFVESAKKVFMPEEVEYSVPTLVIVMAGIIVKFGLGLYVKKKGRDISSNSLVASGADAFNDAILSISVLASAIIYMMFQVNLEAYVGVLLSIFIMKAGLELIKGAVDNVLGMRIDGNLAKAIKREVMQEEDVKGAFDLVLNDYGPDKYLGSIHVEVPDTMNAVEIDKMSRSIMKRVSEKYGVVLHTIGIYSVSTKDKANIEAKKKVEQIVSSYKEVLQMHGFYLDKDDKTIRFDIIIDFKTKKRDQIYREIRDKVRSEFEGYAVMVTLDVDMSD